MSSGAPEYILAAARILGHGTLTTTIEHYEQSSMLAAGAHLNDFIGQLQAENNGEEDKEDLFDLPFEQPFVENKE